jgi:zinc finger SWIM domain-containing protein 3
MSSTAAAPLTLALKQSFDSLEAAAVHISNYCVLNNIRYYVRNNDKGRRYCIRCKSKGCTFAINCCKNAKTTHITKLVLDHSCDQFANLPVPANTAFITRQVNTVIADNPQMPVSQIQALLRRESGVEVPYWAGWKGRRKSLNHFYGDMDESFSFIGSFIQKINESGNGDLGVFETIMIDGETKFHRCFICFRACQMAMRHCKPIIMLDACHIKNSYLGVVIAASTVDGEGAIVNVAFALAPIENQDHWNWFLAQLKHAIPYLREQYLAAISDRAKGLINAVHQQFPNWEHCFCVHHIQENIKSSHPFPDDLHRALWSAASTLSEQEFVLSMEHIEKYHPGVFEYLNGINRRTWTTCYARVPKFQHTTSNVAESFNSWIGNERFRPHLHIIMGISRKVMQLFHEKRMQYFPSAVTTAVYGPTIQAKLTQAIDAGRSLQLLPSSTSVYLVKSNRSDAEEHRVDLQDKTCTCLYFQQQKCPCMHAARAIRDCRDRSIHDFVHESYKLHSLRLNLFC